MSFVSPLHSGPVRMPLIWGLVGIMAGIELALWLGDSGFFPVDHGSAVLYGAFWAALLGEVEPVFALQPYTMYVTHAFLHGGLAHLALNVTILLSLGRMLVLLVGQGRVLLLFLLSVIGGGAMFGLLAGDAFIPMIGASGGGFGFIAAWKRWELAVHRRRGEGWGGVGRFLIAFGLLNIGLIFLMPSIAWQAHLGGFVAGWLLAPVLARRA